MEKIDPAEDMKDDEERGPQPGLLTNAEDVNKIKTWINNAIHQEVRFELLWKGSVHGFKSKEFHTRCDGKAPTLTLIRSEHGKVFGGFTTVAWGFGTQEEGKYQKDDNAFIFSLDNKKHFFKQRNEKSVWDHPNNGPIFGGGCDIHVADECGKNRSSHCYQHDKDTTFGVPKELDPSYFAGDKHFVIFEVEVYQTLPL